MRLTTTESASDPDWVRLSCPKVGFDLAPSILPVICAAQHKSSQINPPIQQVDLHWSWLGRSSAVAKLGKKNV